ncbi:MAG: hypothetical protein AB7I27_09440 [Bacteriovoracaceae bacterium]
MKVFFVAALLISTSAFAACPNLAGHYANCRSTTGQSAGSRDLDISQSTSNGITTYTVTSTSNEDQQRTTDTVVADGRTYTATNTDESTGMTMQTQTTNACVGDSLRMTVVALMQSQQVGNVTVMVTKKGTQIVQAFQGQVFGQSMNDTLICE